MSFIDLPEAKDASTIYRAFDVFFRDNITAEVHNRVRPSKYDLYRIHAHTLGEDPSPANRAEAVSRLEAMRDIYITTHYHLSRFDAMLAAFSAC